jgi:hypothetical protein
MPFQSHLGGFSRDPDLSLRVLDLRLHGWPILPAGWHDSARLFPENDLGVFAMLFGALEPTDLSVRSCPHHRWIGALVLILAPSPPTLQFRIGSNTPKWTDLTNIFNARARSSRGEYVPSSAAFA